MYALTKRLLDIVFAMAGVVFCALVYLPVAIAIKLNSPGPVIFAQERVGKNNTIFKCYKFRTMYVTDDIQAHKPDSEDKRVTRVGYTLRRWSVDELPQFWNILMGEMSMVGPRPELVAVVQQYQSWQHRRHSVRPGLTGWWQINGRKQPMSAYTHEDLYYVDHQSLALDLWILWRSIQAVITGKGAS